MSGHSKWATIKRQKGVTDARRGAVFTKAANAITIAAKQGGGNPETNFKLRLAIESAKQVNTPKENIERAINRAVSVAKEGRLEEIIYEGFGPFGVGVLVEAVTENRQRTAQEVRSIFERAGGHLAGPGSVAHLFAPVGEVVIRAKDDLDPDHLLLVAADAGADDVELAGGEAIIYCKIPQLKNVKEKIAGEKYEIIETRLSRKPTSSVQIEDEKTAASILSLVSKLDDVVDVQRIYANFDIPNEMLMRNTSIKK